MINPKDLDNIHNKLNDCNTAKEMFDVLHNYFDLQNCRIGSVIKPMFIKGIITGLKLISPKVKHEHAN
jgi:hypothetical protein